MSVPRSSAKVVRATVEEESIETQPSAETTEPVVVITKKRRKLKIFLISLATFLVVAATALMIAGYFTPFYVNQTILAGNYSGIALSQDLTVAGNARLNDVHIDLFALAKYRDALLALAPGYAPMYTEVDLAIAGFALFIVAIPVIVASAFVKGQLAAAPAPIVSAE